VIATGALPLTLSTTSVVPPPQPAVAAELTREYFDLKIGELKRTIEDTNNDLKKTIQDGNDKIVTAIKGLYPTPEPHHPIRPPPQVVVVQKPIYLPHRPHWCCRPPPPPPCPPWGW
jgi:hypothetical protein